MKSFAEKLSTTLHAANIDPTKYLQQCDGFIPFYTSNKSASAHLSQTKLDYQYMISTRWHDVYAPEDEAYYNRMIADNLVSYSKRDYDKPARRFYHELILRKWI